MANKSTDARKHVSLQTKKSANVALKADTASLLQRAQEDPKSLRADEIKKLHTLVETGLSSKFLSTIGQETGE
ncbi:MAG: hypothetical protein R2856_35565 [Caldilineaceae bacterium]